MLACCVYECDEDNDPENHDTMRMRMKMPMGARTTTRRTRRSLYYIGFVIYSILDFGFRG